MPGYISITPRFNPISLQEYLTVPTMIMNEYGKAEDVYNETATKAEALKALLGERNANNEAGWRIVDNYEKQLGDLASEMANGIQGPETYRRAKQSRAYYTQNMLPLETGIPAYQEDLKRWESDPTMIGNKPSLGTYISNPLYREDMVSGNLIQQEAMKAATAASARRKSNPKYGTAFGGSYHTIMNQIGFSPEEVQAWLNNPESSPELTEIYNQIASKYGKFNIEQVNPYIIRGMLDGIAYDNKTDYKENIYAKAELEYNNWKRKMEYTARQKASEQDDDYPVVPAASSIEENNDNQSRKNKSFNMRIKWYKAHPEDIVYKLPSMNEFMKDKLSPELYAKYKEIMDKANKGNANIPEFGALGAMPEFKQASREYDKLQEKYNNTQEFMNWVDQTAKLHPELDLSNKAFIGVGLPENNYKLERRLNLTPEVIDALTNITDKNLAFKTTPLTFNLTNTANKQLLESLFASIRIEGDGNNVHIIDEDGDFVSNATLRDIRDKHAGQITVDNNLWILEANGEKYYLKPGAWGSKDFEIRTALDALYNNGDIPEYDFELREYMKMLADWARTKGKGQSETDAKLDEQLLP